MPTQPIEDPLPRIRSVKPEFWTSADIASLSIGSRLTFIGLWNMAEDNGVGVANEKLLAASLYPMDDHSEAVARVQRALAELSRGGQILIYETGKRRLYYITAWDEHQKIDRVAKNFKNDRPDSESWPVSCDNDGSMQAQLVLVEDSSSPRSARASGAGSREQGEEGSGGTPPAAGAAPPPAAAPPSKRRKPQVPLPSDWSPKDRHKQFATEKGLNLERETNRFRTNAYSNDKRMRDWDMTFDTWLDRAIDYNPRMGRASGDSHTEAWR